VTVTGRDDVVVDGDVSFSVVFAAATSDDSNFAGFVSSDVGVTTLDGTCDLAM
jgi:hypothetical protein